MGGQQRQRGGAQHRSVPTLRGLNLLRHDYEYVLLDFGPDGARDREKDGATVTIRYTDVRKGVVVLDVNGSEVADLAAKGTKRRLRGRPPKAAR